jgi:hypothetical protein
MLLKSSDKENLQNSFNNNKSRIEEISVLEPLIEEHAE